MCCSRAASLFDAGPFDFRVGTHGVELAWGTLDVIEVKLRSEGLDDFRLDSLTGVGMTGDDPVAAGRAGPDDFRVFSAGNGGNAEVVGSNDDTGGSGRGFDIFRFK